MRRSASAMRESLDPGAVRGRGGGMSDRLFAACAALVTLVVLAFAAEREGLIRMPWRPAPEAATPSAPLWPTWKPYPAPGKQVGAPLPSTAAAPGWLALRDEALAAFGAQRFQEALDACGRAVAAAEPAGAAHHALALLTCGGMMGLHRRASRQAEDWLRQAVAITAQLDQQAIVAALGPRESMLKERGLRMLAVFYRDQNRRREAAANFALAVEAVRALPPPETSAHWMALRSDLYDLGVVLAQLGLRGTARQALSEARGYYLNTEPKHPTLKAIDEQLKRLEEPDKQDFSARRDVSPS